MDNAKLIFDEIVQLGYKKITSFVDNQQEENLFIDFKDKSDPNKLGVGNDDKRIFAKAVSAFSNSAGGLIVWGIDARKNDKDSPDVAFEKKPIKALRKFLTDLNSLISGAVVPLNPGIINHPIFLDDNEDSDEGFLVTYIPESHMPPHRAMFSDNKYYTRAGDSFLIMEHHILEDSFGRRQKPKLEILYRLNGGPRSGNIDRYDVIFGIRNVGKYVATYPAIRIKPNGLTFQTYSAGVYSYNLTPVRFSQIEKEGQLFSGGINDPIHPNTSLEVSYLNPSSGWLNNSELTNKMVRGDKLSFNYEIFAMGCQPINGIVEITPEEIMDFLKI